LDSVHAGPGINDDGSGVSMMLETAEQMKALGIAPENKVRFIFFSGEEQGLLGSDYYVSQLTKKQIQDISVMLDFDMLASPNYGRFIYDGNGDEHGFAGPHGSGTIERVFKDFWTSLGLAYETIPFDGRSYYDAFTAAGIPAGGIFPGAEVVKQPPRSNCTAARPMFHSTGAITSSATTWTTSMTRVRTSTPTPQFTRSSPSPRLNQQ
jgi:Zn-dependent M28 family amino/carboxypeptidase